MTAVEKLTMQVIDSQEALFLKRFDEVVRYFRTELKALPYDMVDLDQLKYESLPNIFVYVDYAISGFSYRSIDIERIDILNTDEEHLTEAENMLESALSEIVEALNTEAENDYLDNLRYEEQY